MGGDRVHRRGANRRLGDDPSAIAAAYDGEGTTMALAAGWFSFVLLGRVLFVAALRRAFHESGRRSTLLDFALGARLFPAWVGWLGVVGGALFAIGGMIGAAALGDTGDFHDIGQVPLGFGGVVFWTWMLATSVILWRRRPRTTANPVAA